jgi:hypothetical protein
MSSLCTAKSVSKSGNAFKKRKGKTCPSQKELSDYPYF